MKTRNIQKGLSLLLLFVVQTQMTFAAAFKDVSDTDPQAQAIQELVLRKVINGYPDKTFKPAKFITRGEFLKMIFSDIGYQTKPTSEKSPFIDVDGKSWLGPYTKKALELNVINANGAKPTFNPNKPLSRIEAMKIAFPIAGIATPYYTDIDPSELYKDVPSTSAYAYLARAAKRTSIVFSKTPDLFGANRLLTRGDAAELIYQLQQARENEGLTNTSTETPTITVEPPEAPTTPPTLDSNSDLLSNPKFAILMDIWAKANNDFYDKGKITREELIYGAIEGMVEKLGDQYTVFEEPTAANGLRQFLEGELEGIGTEIDFINNNIVIKNVLPNSPAERSNIKTGDIIKEIDGKSLEKLMVNQVVDLICGEAGTIVTLTLQRGTQTMDVKITRAKISLNSVEGKMINSIAYIKLRDFTKTTSTDFTQTLNDLNLKSPKGYIIDLRDNPGGYVDTTIKLLGHFVESGKLIVSIKTANSNNTQYFSDGAGELKNKPIVILMNKDSASAAEIMAGTLQDYKIAKLVGTQSHGKGSVQELTNYADKSLLKLTIAHWITPNGRDINGIGLTPDLTVELNEAQLLKGVDTQLQKAIEIINAS